MQLMHRLAVIRQAAFEHFVVGLWRRGHETHADFLQCIPGFNQVITEEGDVLNAFAIELHQKLFDLPCTFGRFFVQGDTDHAVRGRHGFGGQAGVFALDVEVANFTEVEQLFVEISPVRHAAAIHVMGQMVDDFQASAHRMAIHTFDEHKVDVIDRAAFTVTVDQVQRRAADAFDRWQVEFHRTRRDFDRLRTQFQRTGVGLLGIAYTKRHAAHRRAVFSREVGRHTVRLVIEDQVDVALTIQVHVF